MMSPDESTCGTHERRRTSTLVMPNQIQSKKKRELLPNPSQTAVARNVRRCRSGATRCRFDDRRRSLIFELIQERIVCD
jgi:hypothetical protein